MFSLPRAHDQPEEGSSQNLPLLLEGVRLKDLISFARVAESQYVPFLYAVLHTKRASAGAMRLAFHP
jgi:hypothetical protein